MNISRLLSLVSFLLAPALPAAAQVASVPIEPAGSGPALHVQGDGTTLRWSVDRPAREAGVLLSTGLLPEGRPVAGERLLVGGGGHPLHAGEPVRARGGRAAGLLDLGRAPAWVARATEGVLYAQAYLRSADGSLELSEAVRIEPVALPRLDLGPALVRGDRWSRTVELSRPTGVAVEVPFSLDVPAGSGFELLTPSPLVLRPGERSAEIRVRATTTAARASLAGLGLNLGAPSGAIWVPGLTGAGGVPTTGGTPTVDLTISSESLPEGAGSVSVGVQLSGLAAGPVSIPFTLGGTADGADVQVLTASPLVVNPGLLAGTIELFLPGDALDELDETFELILGAPSGATLGTVTTYTLTLLDDDAAPVVAFDLAGDTQLEGAGPLSVGITLDAPSGLDVSLPFTVGGTADAGDVTVLSASPLLVPAGQTTASIDLDLLGDLLDELDETLVLTLGTPTGATLGATFEHTLTLTDDDAAPVVAFDLASTNAAEGDGVVDILLSLDAPSGLEVTLPFSTLGSATEIDDYVISTPSPLVVPAGDVQVAIQVQLVDDGDVESLEDLEFTLGVPTNATLGAQASHLLLIADEDAGPFSDDFNAANLDTSIWTLIDPLGDVGITFDGTGTPDARLRLSIPSGVDHRAWVPALTAPRIAQPFPDADTSITVKFESSMSQAFQQQGLLFEQDDQNYIRFDYYHNGSSYLLFGGTIFGQTATSIFNQVVPVTGDHWMRVTRTGDSWFQEWSLDGVTWNPGASFVAPLLLDQVSVFVANSTSGTTPRAHTAVVDFFEVASDPIAAEDSGMPTDTTPPLVYSVSSDADTTSLTVDWSTDELASGELRYGLTTGYELGSVLEPNPALGQSLQIPGLDPDTVYNVQIVAMDGSGNTTFGENLVLATDAPPVPVVAWTANGQTASELDGSVTVRAQLDIPAIGDVTVPFVLGGSATEGVDYTVSPASPLLIPDGQTFVDVTVTLLDDGDVEPTEQATLTLGSPSGATLGSPMVHTLTVLDDDGPPVVAFATASDQVSEGSGNVLVTVVLSKVADTAVSVPFSLSGTAAEGPDFTLTPASPLVIPQGLTSGDISISLVDDVDIEGTEDLTITLGTPTGADLGAPAAFDLTVFDNDGVLPFNSDDFNAFNLDLTVWELRDNVGDGQVRLVDQNTTDAALELYVPAGPGHTVYDVLTAPRLVQDVPDQDFSVTVRLEQTLDKAFQGHGLIFEEDADTYVRCDSYFNGVNYRVYAEVILDGVPQGPLVNANIPAPMLGLWLRVTRTGSSWLYEYSVDGTSFVLARAFSQPLALDRAGVFVSNTPPNQNQPAPETTAVFDFIEWATDPIPSEDGGIAVDLLPPFIHAQLPIVGRHTVELEWATDEPATGFVEWGLTPALEMGVEDAPLLGFTQHINIVDLAADTTVYLRVTAEDGDGRTSVGEVLEFTTVAESDPLPRIDVWYGMQPSFGAIGQPQRWAQVQGNASGPNGIFSLSMSLNGGPFTPLEMGPNLRRLELLGDFVAEFDFDDLLPGRNDLRLRALDGANGSIFIEEVVRIDFTPGTTWPSSYVADWSTMSRIDDGAQVVDGKWELQGSSVRILETGYDRLVAIGDEIAWDDYEVTCTVTMHSIDPVYAFPANPGPSVGYLLRWVGHSASSDPGDILNQGFRPLGTIACVQWFQDGSQRLELQDDVIVVGDNSGKTFDFEVPYVFKARVVTSGPGLGTYSFKVWEEGTPEPPAWDVSATMTDDLDTGCLLLLLHYADASYGTVTVTPL